MKECIFTADNFEQDVINSPIPVLVDFWASWCAPCRMLSPIVSEVAELVYGKVKVGKVNVDEEPELTTRFNVMGIPTLLLFKNGQVVDKNVGFITKAELLEFLGIDKI